MTQLILFVCFFLSIFVFFLLGFICNHEIGEDEPSNFVFFVRFLKNKENSFYFSFDLRH